MPARGSPPSSSLWPPSTLAKGLHSAAFPSHCSEPEKTASSWLGFCSAAAQRRCRDGHTAISYGACCRELWKGSWGGVFRVKWMTTVRLTIREGYGQQWSHRDCAQRTEWLQARISVGKKSRGVACLSLLFCQCTWLQEGKTLLFGSPPWPRSFPKKHRLRL